MESESSEIVEFFTGKSILITGGTGFVGKTLIEKILRSCPEVVKIYVLIREKRKQCPAVRLQNLLNEPIFQELKKLQPNFNEKVVGISGDATIPKLGICSEDVEVLKKHVSIIIHSAATVNFTDPLKISLNINLRGTSRVMKIAKEMKCLQALVYVSTAFSNCEMSIIEEKIYPVAINPKDALHLLDNLSDELFDCISPSLLKDKPNSYTYSKQLSEALIDQWKTELPLCIVRPAVITGAANDPIPGFVDNFTGMSGILAGIMTGCIHTLHFNDEFRLDTVPVDYVVNLILAAACRRAKTSKRSELQIYNLTSYENPLHLNAITHIIENFSYENPFRKTVTYPYIYFITNKTIYTLSCFCFHRLPAICFDVVARAMGQKKMFKPIYEKVGKNIDVLEYFTSNKWTIRNENTKALYDSLSPQDKRVFNFNVHDIDWLKYTWNYLSGIRAYVLKETDHYQDGWKKLLKLRAFDLVLKLFLALPVVLAVLLWHI